MQTVRFGVIGLGNMGSVHCANLNGNVENASLAAICDSDAKRLSSMAAKYPSARPIERSEDLITGGLVDVVLVATPHYEHPAMTIAAIERGLHVFCEKPAAVTVREARRMADAAAKHPELKFGINFQMRTQPAMKKIRDLVRNGDLGEINRLTWIVTNWFRTDSYYASGGWRATWAGEGGGVLINQCPHNLDQLYWLTGMMPKRITAVAAIGKSHPIEVEDEVSAILEYPNGATGHFITTTGEAPGSDRLEIAGDRGNLIAENGKLHLRLNRQSAKEFCKTSPLSFAAPECWDIDIPVEKPHSDGARLMAQNFADAVLNNEPLIAPGAEGIKGLEIGNAMMLAGLSHQPVELPLDLDAFDRMLKRLTEEAARRKR